jgi:hypothetical protein
MSQPSPLIPDRVLSSKLEGGTLYLLVQWAGLLVELIELIELIELPELIELVELIELPERIELVDLIELIVSREWV